MSLDLQPADKVFTNYHLLCAQTHTGWNCWLFLLFARHVFSITFLNFFPPYNHASNNMARSWSHQWHSIRSSVKDKVLWPGCHEDILAHPSFFYVSSFLNIMQSFRLHTKCKIQKWLCCQSADQGEHKASHHNIKRVTIHKIIVWKSVAFSKCCRHHSIMTGFIHSLLTRNCQLLNQWLTCCPACINFIITLYQMLLEFHDRCWQQDTNCNNKGKNKELREQKAGQHANCSSESQWCTKSLGSEHKQEEDVRVSHN